LRAGLYKRKMKRIRIFILLFAITQGAAGQDEPKEILEKCFMKCTQLKGGSFRMDFTKRSFNEDHTSASSSECRFLKVEGDSASPFKFYISMNNGDGTLCTSNDLVQLRGRDSTGVIYSRNTNQSIYRGALQSEGLFPPFFQPQVIFSLDRLEQTTFIVRKGKDTEANGKPCFTIKLIDLIRATLPDGQRQEKTFLIDKQTFLPVFYSEKSMMKLGADSVSKENTFRITELSTEPLHDSLFTFKNIPQHFRLRNILESVYHHHLRTGISAPDFTGMVNGGDSVTLKSLSGKKVLLFFFSRSCYPCLKALSAMQEFQNENKEVKVLLVAIDAGEKELADLLSKRNITLQAIHDGLHVADSYYISAAPTFVLIDEKGIIKEITNGFGQGTVEGLE
jgi:peroxiredoxin